MTDEILYRRRLLQGTGAGLATMVAGCLGGDGTGNSNGETNNSSGGSSSSEKNPEVHVLTDYSSKPWQKKWETKIVPGFEKKYPAPLKVEYSGMQGAGESRLTVLMQSGSAPECYTGTLTQVGDLVAQGQTLNLTDLISEIEQTNGEMLFKNTVSVNGAPQLFPHGVYLGGTFNYRKDIYEKLGLSVPTTWDELIANTKAIDEAEDVQAAGFAMPAGTTGKSGSDFSNWFYNAGGRRWRWKDEAETEVELAFDEEHVTASLELMRELAKYSPDPSSISWGSTIKYWVGGRVAQCLMNNAWLTGPAYRAGAKDIALNTGISLVPKRAGSDPLDRGWVLIDGTPIIKSSDNHQGAKNLLRYMYGSPAKQAKKNLIEPMRFLPPYKGVMKSDVYQSAPIFQAENGHFYELNRKCMEEIAPHLGSDKRPSTVATLYAGRFGIDAQMVNAAVVRDMPVSKAYQKARRKYQKRVKQGKKLSS